MNKMGRRSRSQIFGEILNTIYHGAFKPTKIMVKTNLSWISLEKRIIELLERGFVDTIETGKKLSHTHYKLTAKGKIFLNAWNVVQEMFF